MARVIIKRILSLIPVIWIISVMTFVLLNMAASDTATILLEKDGIKATEAALEIKRAELGLDRPLYVQYFSWLKGVLKLDFGTSYRTGKPVTQEIMKVFPATFRLALAAFLMLVTVSVLLGVLSALYPNSIIDFIGRMLSYISISMPSFWIGMLLLYLFAVRWKMVPVISDGSAGQVVLPAVTLMLGYLGSYIRYLRGTVLEILEKGYIKATRAKGVREAGILCRHVLKNAMLPMITRFGMSFGGMLGGASIIEAIFSWPGLGSYVLDAINCRDIPAVQGYVIFLACVIVFVNLLVDLLYAVIDPRIRVQ